MAHHNNTPESVLNPGKQTIDFIHLSFIYAPKKNEDGTESKDYVKQNLQGQAIRANNRRGKKVKRRRKVEE